MVMFIDCVFVDNVVVINLEWEGLVLGGVVSLLIYNCGIVDY